ncbi:MAG: YnbE family lipoprotein [Kiloniellaceae bacterium]|uniref:YnbE family lipoprotein n=1 Tax=Pelagibius sp. 7325 TaxID=3131994 RepID=UPI0030ED3673
MVSFGARRAALGGALLCFALAACTPTVQVAAPKEPITINLNVKLDAEVRVKIEEQAAKDIQENPDVF